MEVDVIALAREASRLEGVADDIERRIAAARSRISELVRSGRRGSATAALMSEYSAWDDAARSRVDELRALVADLHGSARIQVGAERQATSPAGVGGR